MSKKKKKKAKRGCAGFLLFLILAAGLAALVYLMQKGELSLPTLTIPSNTTSAETSDDAEITFPSLEETDLPTETSETTSVPSETLGTEAPSDTDGETEAISDDAPPASDTEAQTTPDSTVQPVTTLPETTPPVIEVSWEPNGMSDSYEFDGETVYFSTINRPVFSGTTKESSNKINNTLKDFCESFVKLSSEDKLLAEEAYENARFDYEPYERSGDCTVYVRDNVLSVLFHLYRNTGGTDTVNEYKAFVFDLATGDTMNFADYIGKNTVFSRQYVVSVFSQLIDLSPRDFFSDAKEILGSSASLDNFYLTEEALVLFCNPNTLASSAHGVLSVEVPYSKLEKQ